MTYIYKLKFRYENPEREVEQGIFLHFDIALAALKKHQADRQINGSEWLGEIEQVYLNRKVDFTDEPMSSETIVKEVWLSRLGRTTELSMTQSAGRAGIYDFAQEDLARIIAQETSGLEGAIPEQDDLNLADLFIKIINGQARYEFNAEQFQLVARVLM